MELSFAKLHGLGNDFVFIDDRDCALDLTDEQVSYLCDRHFGIGGRRRHPRAAGSLGRGRRLHALHQRRRHLGPNVRNGVHCFAKYLVDRELADVASGSLVADTLAGRALSPFPWMRRGR